MIAGADLAAFLRADAAGEPARQRSSARNRFPGIVTNIVVDTVMAQVEIQAGPHRVVSLMSREAQNDLQLDIGSIVTAVVKSTNVIVENSPASGDDHA